MKIHKKTALTAGVLVLGALLLTGCRQANSAPNPGGGPILEITATGGASKLMILTLNKTAKSGTFKVVFPADPSQEITGNFQILNGPPRKLKLSNTRPTSYGLDGEESIDTHNKVTVSASEYDLTSLLNLL